MLTTEAPAAPADTTVIIGVVSTAPVYTQSLPDHMPHVSFHVDTAEGPGYNVHADGALAELARVTVRRHTPVNVVPKRIYRLSPNQLTPDVDAEAIDITAA